MAGALEGKAIAVTGAGRGIGRAIAVAAAAEGAAVVVNDYGVSIDGNEPTSQVANEVVAEITAAGGRAVGEPELGDDDGGRRVDRAASDRQLRACRRRGVRCRHLARAHVVQHVRGRVGSGHRDAPQGHVHRVPRRGAEVFRAQKTRHPDRIHVGRVRRERRAGQLLRGKGRDRLAGPQRGRRDEQVRRDRELHCTGREVAHVGQCAVRPRDG